MMCCALPHMSQESPIPHLPSINGQALFWTIIKTAASIALVFVAFGSCVAAWPNITNLVRINERTSELEKARAVTDQEIASMKSSISKIELSLNSFLATQEAYRKGDDKFQSELSTRLNSIDGRLGGINSAITGVQTDSSTRANMIESRVNDLREKVLNAVTTSERLEDRVSELEVDTKAGKSE